MPIGAITISSSQIPMVVNWRMLRAVSFYILNVELIDIINWVLIAREIGLATPALHRAIEHLLTAAGRHAEAIPKVRYVFLMHG